MRTKLFLLLLIPLLGGCASESTVVEDHTFQIDLSQARRPLPDCASEADKRRVQDIYSSLRQILPDAPPLQFELGQGGGYYNPVSSIAGEYIAVDAAIHRHLTDEDVRFILAHELGHWLHYNWAPEEYQLAHGQAVMFRDTQWNGLVYTRQDAVQYFADQFALSLMPPGFDLWGTVERLHHYTIYRCEEAPQ